jgi:hypothetical protein
MQFRALAIVATLGALGGCVTAEERQAMYSTPAPPHHATAGARKAVAVMAIRTNKYPPKALLVAVKEAKYSVFHVADPKIGSGARTIYCVWAPITPMIFGKEVNVPIGDVFSASVRVMDNEKGGLSTWAVGGGSCSKAATEPFPELFEVARALVEAEKNRPPPPPPPEK